MQTFHCFWHSSRGSIKFIKFLLLPWIITIHIYVYFFLGGVFFFVICLCVYHALIAFVSFIFVSMYFYLFMSLWVGILQYNFTITWCFFRKRYPVHNLVLFIYFLLFFVRFLLHTLMIMYIFQHFVVLIIFNICFQFALLLVSLHGDQEVTNASFYLCMFLYIYVPVHVFKCWYFIMHFYYIGRLISL